VIWTSLLLAAGFVVGLGAAFTFVGNAPQNRITATVVAVNFLVEVIEEV
jgi:hypothetical protein